MRQHQGILSTEMVKRVDVTGKKGERNHIGMTMDFLNHTCSIVGIIGMDQERFGFHFWDIRIGKIRHKVL